MNISKIISGIAYLLHNYFDPDQDKELNPEFQQSLLKIRQQRQQGRKTVSFEELRQNAYELIAVEKSMGSNSYEL